MNQPVSTMEKETAGPIKPRSAPKSVLVLSADPGLCAGVKDALKPLDCVNTTIDASARGADVQTLRRRVFGHDLVILDVNPDDVAEMAQTKGLLADRQVSDIRYLAIASAELPLVRARELIQAGIDEVLPSGYSDDELRDAVQQRLFARTERLLLGAAQQRTAGKRGSVIAVSAARGGAGASSVAVNLAALLLNRQGLFRPAPGKKVVIVDLDLQFGTLGSMLDVEDNGAMMQIIRSGVIPDSVMIRTIVAHHPSGLDVVPAPAEAVPLEALRGDQISALVEVLRQDYDYVVIDLPRALVIWLEPLLSRTDRVLMVTDTSVPSIRQCRRLMDIYREDNIGLNIDIVVNGESRPLIRSSHHKEAAILLERPLNHWLPRDDRAMRLSADRGVPLVTLSKRSKLAAAYRATAQGLQKLLNEKTSGKA